MKKVSLGFTLLTLLALIAVQLGLPTSFVSAAPTGHTIWHYVLPGQNLYRISLMYGVSQQAIINANGIVNPNRIMAYQYLRIPHSYHYPPPTGFWYQVKPGDTLTSLAWRYGTTIARIKAANPGKIWNVNLIYAWDTIWIPQP